MKKELNLPCVVATYDYHEFDQIQWYLEQMGLNNVSYEELNNELMEAPYYHAIFYVGSKNSNENRKYFSNLKKELLTSYKEATGEDFNEDVY